MVGRRRPVCSEVSLLSQALRKNLIPWVGWLAGQRVMTEQLLRLAETSQVLRKGDLVLRMRLEVQRKTWVLVVQVLMSRRHLVR